MDAEAARWPNHPLQQTGPEYGFSKYYAPLRVNRSPPDTPSGPPGIVLTVEFMLASSRFIAPNVGPMYSFAEAVSFQTACADQTEVDRLGAALAQGPLEVALAGVAHPAAGIVQRPGPRLLAEAMLEINKIIIAELERAADGR